MYTQRCFFFCSPRSILFFLLMAAFVCAMSITAEPAYAKKRPYPEYGGYTGQQEQSVGGYTGPGPEVIAVQNVSSLGDDTWVALRGTITHSLG